MATKKADHGHTIYKANAKELQVIQECVKESMYYRAATAAVFGSLAFITAKSGYMKSGRKGGPWPQVICAAAVGYYVGKYSNQLLRNKFYKDKLMLIPNSVLGESVRISKERKAKGKKSTPEQVTVLKQWFEKTFYSQSLPVGASLGLGAFIAVKSGYLRSSATLGPWPKVLVAATTGIFIGLDSNLGQLSKQFMALPSGPLAEAHKRVQMRKSHFAPMKNQQRLITDYSSCYHRPDYVTASIFLDVLIKESQLSLKDEAKRLENYKNLLLLSSPPQPSSAQVLEIE